eukprot:scaffold5479_cov199-Amphora_coffeaeformis.AAC.10
MAAQRYTTSDLRICSLGLFPLGLRTARIMSTGTSRHKPLATKTKLCRMRMRLFLSRAWRNSDQQYEYSRNVVCVWSIDELSKAKDCWRAQMLITSFSLLLRGAVMAFPMKHIVDAC